MLIALAAVMMPAASPADAAPDQIFTIDCPVAHYLHDDPIVFPGRPGLSHAHAFFGNTTTDAYSTTRSLLAAPSTCQNGFANADHSAYWVPTLMRKTAAGVQEIHGSADDTSLRVYYRRAGDQKVTRFPQGLHMIAGNHMATSPQPYDAFHFRCRDVHTLAFIGGDSAAIPSCTSDQFLMEFLHFPNCWDGKNLDPADHMSHMTDDNNGVCPASHPVKLPALNYEISYFNVNGPSSQLSLSSGGQYSLHGDFVAAWDPGVQQALIDKCINAGSAPCFGVNMSDVGVAPASSGSSTSSAHNTSSTGARTSSGKARAASPKTTLSPPRRVGLRAAAFGHAHAVTKATVFSASPRTSLTASRSTLPGTVLAVVAVVALVGLGAFAYAYNRRIRRRSLRNRLREQA